MPENTTVTKAKAAPAKSSVTKNVKKAGKNKSKSKEKIVRDSFSMPQSDFKKIAELKQACLKAGVHVKKSELLRAGLQALGKLSAAQLKRAITQLGQTKTVRPKKTGAKLAANRVKATS